MKLLVFLLAAIVLVAQPSTPPSVIYVTSDPAGACVASVQLRFNTSNGKLWGCNALTWGQIGGGGGASWTGSAGQLAFGINSSTLGGSLVSFDPTIVGKYPVLSNGASYSTLFTTGSYTDTVNPGAVFEIVIDGTAAASTYTTTLNGAIDDVVTTITVGSTTGFPDGNYQGGLEVQINSEIFCVETVSGTTWTVDRACGGTAASHLNGATVTALLDTFKWRKNTGSYTTGVFIPPATDITPHDAAANLTLSDGVVVYFNSSRNHGGVGVTYQVTTGVTYIKNSAGQIIAYAGEDGEYTQTTEFQRNSLSLYGENQTAFTQTVAGDGVNYWYYYNSGGTLASPATSGNGAVVGSAIYVPYLTGSGFGGGLGVQAVVTDAVHRAVTYQIAQESDLGFFVTSFTPQGGFGLPACTAATLGTRLVNNGDQCMCTDCKPTSGSDDTCTGSGGLWLAYKTASANVCR
jgi:hypothetical protein